MKTIKQNKKALSDVVASVLLIILAISSIIIVWQVIKITINKTQLSPDLCLNPEIKIIKACYNSETNELEIALERKLPQQEINELDFALTLEDQTEIYTCSNNCNNCIILDSGTKTYYFQQQADKVTIKYGNCLENKNVEEC